MFEVKIMTQNEKFFESKREWSHVKDDLLTCYLMPYFTKILATGKLIIYIDGFAGKGKFDDGLDGSPLLALKTFREAMKKSHHGNSQEVTNYKMPLPMAKFYFIEKKEELVKSLNSNIQSFYNQHVDMDHKVISYTGKGNCWDKLESCLKSATNANVFLYMDPYGIKDYDFNIFSKLASKKYYSFEYLCNYNTFGFFRAACSALNISIKSNDSKYFSTYEEDSYKECRSIQNLNRAYGSDDWQKIVKAYHKNELDGVQAEKKIAEGIQNNLRKYFKYVLNMPIRIKEGNVPKYRMFHVANKVDGCILMAYNMQKRNEELIYSVQGQQEESLFGNDYVYSEQGNLIDITEVQRLLKIELAKVNSFIQYKDFLADFFTNYGIPCPLPEFNKIMKQLEKEKFILVEREPKQNNNGTASKFWSENNNHKIYIKIRK